MGGRTLPLNHVENKKFSQITTPFAQKTDKTPVLVLVVDMYTKITSERVIVTLKKKKKTLPCHPKKGFDQDMGVHIAHNLSYWNWATSGEGQLECNSETYCRRRYQSPLVALLHWPRSGLGHHSRSSHQSRLTQRWWPGLWSQTFQHGQPEGEKKFLLFAFYNLEKGHGLR